MAESTFAIDIPNDLENDTTNAPADVDANFTEVETQFNAAFETSTGHYHDGTDSRLVFGGVTDMTAEEAVIANIMGGMA